MRADVHCARVHRNAFKIAPCALQNVHIYTPVTPPSRYLPREGLTGPKGRVGRPGNNGKNGDNGVCVYGKMVNGTVAKELLIPPSIACRYSRARFVIADEEH